MGDASFSAGPSTAWATSCLLRVKLVGSSVSKGPGLERKWSPQVASLWPGLCPTLAQVLRLLVSRELTEHKSGASPSQTIGEVGRQV